MSRSRGSEFYRRLCPRLGATHQSSLKMYLILCLSDYASNLAHMVLNAVELELVYNFSIFSCSSSKISWTKVQFANVGIQPEISQE